MPNNITDVTMSRCIVIFITIAENGEADSMETQPKSVALDMYTSLHSECNNGDSKSGKCISQMSKNRMVKICYGYPCLRQMNLSFNGNFIVVEWRILFTSLDCPLVITPSV
jgi:hypothetical protein